MNDTLTFEFLKPLETEKPGGGSSAPICSPPFDRQTYVAECEKRWSGEPLRDARRNWHAYQELHADLLEAMRQYKRNPMLKDVSGKCHNPEGTLTALLWKMQEAWQPDKSCLYPLLDFCDHYQKVFLRRGLVIYCTMLLRQMEANACASHPGTDAHQ